MIKEQLQMEPGSYIVMDLEFNSPQNRSFVTKNGIALKSEIIEIGAVKLDKDRNTVDTFRKFVRPDAYLRMRDEVVEITEITTEMIWEGEPFADVIGEFLDWCGEDFVFITWSENDIFAIEDNMLYHGLSIDGLPECYDIQLMFDDQITMYDKRMPLNYAIWKFGFKPEPQHDALSDAINTAEVFRRLDVGELEKYVV